MIKKIKIVLICLTILVAAVTAAACNFESPSSSPQTDETENNRGTSAQSTVVNYPEDMFSKRDLNPEYDEKTATKIELASEDIEITKEGTYIISGTLSDGQVVVNASDKDKIQLVLNNAEINSNSSAPIYVKSADKVFITLAEGSTNTLSVGGEYENNDENTVDSVVFSKDDVTFNGRGKLIINAKYGHGIVGKDDVKFCGGTYEIESENKGISANDSIRIADGEFTIKSGKDSFHAENTEDEAKGFVYIAAGKFNMDAGYDGISASGTLQIDGGDFNITAGGGSQNAESTWAGSYDGISGSTRPTPPDTIPDSGSGPTANPGWGNGNSRDDKNNDNGDDNDDAGAIVYTSFDAVSSATKSQGNDNSNGQQQTQPQTPQFQNPQEQWQNSSENTSRQTGENSTKGIKSGTTLTINEGTFIIDAADDAVHSNGDIYINGGTFEIETGDDAVHADGNLVVNDGNITVKTCYEGLEGLSVTVKAGNIDITALDDGLNAADGTGAQMGGGFEGGPGGRPQGDFGGSFGGSFGGKGSGEGFGAHGRPEKQPPNGGDTSGDFDTNTDVGGQKNPGNGGNVNEDCFIRIEGGTIKIATSGNDADGIDSNGNLFVTGGTMYIYGTAPIDYDGNATITGGTVIAYGGANMAQNFGNDSTQGSFLVRLSQTAQTGSAVVLKDKNAKEILTYSLEHPAQCIIISTPELEKGVQYSLEVAGKTYDLS